MSEGLSRGSFVKVAASCDFYEYPLIDRSEGCSVVGVGLFLNPTPCHAASAGFGAEPRASNLGIIVIPHW